MVGCFRDVARRTVWSGVGDVATMEGGSEGGAIEAKASTKRAVVGKIKLGVKWCSSVGDRAESDQVAAVAFSAPKRRVGGECGTRDRSVGGGGVEGPALPGFLDSDQSREPADIATVVCDDGRGWVGRWETGDPVGELGSGFTPLDQWMKETALGNE